LTEGMDFTNEDDLGKLTRKYAKENYDWYETAYKSFCGKPKSWYGGLFEKLLMEVRGVSEKEAKEIVGRVRELGKKPARVAAKKRLKYTIEEVKEKFRELTGEVDFTSEDDLKRLVFDVVKDAGWLSSAGTIFTGTAMNWYGALEKLLVEVRGLSEEEATEIVGKVRAIGKTTQKNLKYNEEEVKEKFRGLTEGMDFTNEGNLGKLTRKYAKENYDWVYTAGNLFGKGHHDWYGALEKLFVEVKGLSEKEATEIVGRVKAIGRRSNRNQKLILVDSQTVVNGRSIDLSPMAQVIDATENAAMNGTTIESSGVQRVVLSSKHAPQKPSDAQRMRLEVGRPDWNKLAGDYSKHLGQIAPFVVVHLAIDKLVQLAKKRVVEWPKRVLSQASGPSSFLSALTRLKGKIESAGFEVPKVVDLDLSREMLERGANKGSQIHGNVRAVPLVSGSVSMVENITVYQFRNPELVKDALVEANRVSEKGGVLLLTTVKRPLDERFHDALRDIGYEPLTAPGEALLPSSEFLENVEATLGEDFAQRVKNKTREWYILVAVKKEEVTGEVDAEQFRLRKSRKAIDPWVADIGRVSRSAFKSKRLGELDAHIDLILDLLSGLEGVKPKEVWRIYDRISRLERKKLGELGVEEKRPYLTADKETVRKTRELLGKLKLKSKKTREVMQFQRQI